MSRNFPPTLSTCAKFKPATFVMALFCYLRRVDSALDPHGPLSQTVPRVVIEEVNREVKKAEARPKRTGPLPLIHLGREGGM